MSTSINVEQYRRLPPPIRAQLDDWMDRVGLTTRKITAVEVVDEGGRLVNITRAATDAQGRITVNGVPASMVTFTEQAEVSEPFPVHVLSHVDHR